MEKRSRAFILTINNGTKDDYDNLHADYKCG